MLVVCGNGIYSALQSQPFRIHHRARGIRSANAPSVAIFGDRAIFVDLRLSSIGTSWLIVVYVSLVTVAIQFRCCE